MNACLFFYGKSGSGKSFAGDLLAELLGWQLYHADQDITPEMQTALANQQPFTNAMRDQFFYNVGEKIQQLNSQHHRLIVTQGAYKQKHRDYLKSKLPQLYLVQVNCPDEQIMQRIEQRKSGISLASAKALLADFEASVQGDYVLENGGSRQQLIASMVHMAEQMPELFSTEELATLTQAAKVAQG
ncbi:AAA family ATPase [Reinekea thalattae]|uniref:AAA family ATPase n=1 Tax=Reinekea thalattae TaxID=2593301 RepID=UPI00164EDD7A|nr:AAA family ATPase [Reinekea thalattae]